MFGRLFQRGGATDEWTGQQLHERLQAKEKLLVVDVREPHEHAQGLIPGSRRLPLRDLSNGMKKLPRDRDLVIVCRSGSRSRMATQLLRQNGFDRAYNLRGGLLRYPGPLSR